MDLLNIEREMATRIEYRVKQAIGTEYPKLNFTTEVSDVPPSFPNVYVHEERLTEAGVNLWNKDIHAMDFAIQLVIKTNSTTLNNYSFCSIIFSIVFRLSRMRSNCNYSW